jgi:hypothetical protein
LAVLLVIPTLIGFPLGAFLVGMLSDILIKTVAHPNMSLRYAMPIALSGSLFASGLFFQFGRRLLAICHFEGRGLTRGGEWALGVIRVR